MHGPGRRGRAFFVQQGPRAQIGRRHHAAELCDAEPRPVPSGKVADGETLAMTFVELILYHGLTHPQKPAMILSDRIVTFGMLRQGILSAAERIAAAGLESG